jgi:hypothetical protein
MKITRRQLRRIIKEEIGRSHYRRLRLLREAEPGIVQSHKEAFFSVAQAVSHNNYKETKNEDIKN